MRTLYTHPNRKEVVAFSSRPIAKKMLAVRERDERAETSRARNNEEKQTDLVVLLEEPFWHRAGSCFNPYAQPFCTFREVAGVFPIETVLTNLVYYRAMVYTARFVTGSWAIKFSKV